MAEKLKVFVNKVFTNADIQPDGTIPLISNTATEQAVIKNIDVDTSLLNNSLKYYVQNDGFTIMEDLVDVEGSEIVDNGKALVMVTNGDYSDNVLLDYTEPSDVYVVPSYSGSTITSASSIINYVYNGETINCKYTSNIGDNLYLSVSSAYNNLSTLKVKYPYTVSPVINNLTSTTSTTYSCPSMSNPAWVRIVGNKAYYFHWNGNSVAYLYNATISGTTVGYWSQAVGGDYAFKALDIENDIVYWVSGSTLCKYNLTTQVQSIIGTTTAPSGVDLFSTATFSNGVFFYICNISYNTAVHYYNTNTNGFGNITLDVSLPMNTYTSIAVAYNHTEDKWYIDCGYNSDRKMYTVTGSMSGTKTATTIGSQSLLPFTLNIYQGIVMGDKHGRMLYKCTASGGLSAGWAVVSWAKNTATVIGNTAYVFDTNYQNPIDINVIMPPSTITTYKVTPAAQKVNLDINTDTIPFSAHLKISGVAITEEI